MMRRGIAAECCATLLCAATSAAAATQTVTTTYLYNPDGAPTAVTTQVDAQPATTTYLTWDDFTPDTATPATGSVSAADGNLIGIGASPGLTAQFTYDVRDRLTACNPAGQPAASYAYDPVNSMASSTLASGDALQFYYDNTATPRMINTLQPSTGVAASFLGPVRYLSDGTEQVLLTPRKDTAGVYDAAAQTLSPYSYDPYGASTATAADLSTSARQHASTSAQYDLTENPFQYAAEYRDPTCNAYYLRARWYLPAQQTFLSRDPADGLHRYSYTAGNPVGRVDPSGLKYTGEDFSRDVDKLVHKLTPGIGAYIEPVLPVWGQALGGIELVGLLPSFWHHSTAEGIVTFGFLAASIVTEAGAESRAFDGLFATPARALGGRIGIDLALGASQTAAQSYRHGRLDVPALIQGIDTTLYGILWTRFGAGLGYRPFGLTVDDVDTMAGTHFRNVNNIDQALVFRLRYSSIDSFTSPLLEQLNLGNYHEAVFAITRESLWHADVGLADRTFTWETSWSREVADLNRPSRFLAGGTTRELIFVGQFRRDAVENAFLSEMDAGERDFLMRSPNGQTISPLSDYRMFSNNCQHNAARVRVNIVGFHRFPPVYRLTM